jgi:hypothetical protein
MDRGSASGLPSNSPAEVATSRIISSVAAVPLLIRLDANRIRSTLSDILLASAGEAFGIASAIFNNSLAKKSA